MLVSPTSKLFNSGSSLTGKLGSGCIAALEAEKFLSEQEAELENGLDALKDAEKGNNVVVPEYKSNPLL